MTFEYPREFYEACYDLLVAEGHSRDEPFNRLAFVQYFMEPDVRDNAKEFRFQGHLGFGGKFWRRHTGHDVTCYLEDRTFERSQMITKLNGAIVELEARWRQRCT